MGTRPQVIKLASLVKAFGAEGIDYSIIHTGQHYDFEMDQVFFEELGLPKPEKHLAVGSGSHAYQTGTMVIRLEEALKGSRLVIVPGDTNSALAGALAAVKMGLDVGHVEAGLRSWLPFMPEEVNRVLVDHMSRLLFAPTKAGRDNLVREGIDEGTVHQTGDVMADSILMLGRRIEEAELPPGVREGCFAYVTAHRAENVDDPDNLRKIADMLTSFPGNHGLEVVFPVHPHTRKRMEGSGLMDRVASTEGVHVVKPVSYLTSLRLARDARVVLTDSGGLQKEAFMLGTPAVTMREVTEWVETVDAGWNIVAGLDLQKIDGAVRAFLGSEPKKVDPMGFYGNGGASGRIAGIVRERLG